MRHARLLLLFLLLSIVVAACSDRDDPPPGTANGNGEDSSATTSPTVQGNGNDAGEAPDATQVEGARIMEHARELAEGIGERVAGSEREAAAVTYISDTLESYGYDVTLQRFEFEGNRWPPGTIVAEQTEIPTYSIDGSSEGESSGPLVHAGLGESSDLEDVALDGAVALVDRGVIPFGEKVANVTEAGATAVVIANNEPGPLLQVTLGRRADVPVVGVSLQEGEDLRAIADAGGEATVTASGGTTESVNVLARPEGTDECLVLTGGHHDSVGMSPGANDNASGVAHVLELARVMAEDGMDSGMCFATFGGEESGLFGSQHMAQAMADDDALPQVMFNLDVTGIGLPAGVIGDETLVTRALDVASEAGADVEESQMPANSASDHVSFQEAGSSVVMLTSSNYDTIHTPEDTMDALEPATLETIGIAAAAVLRDLYMEVAAP